MFKTSPKVFSSGFQKLDDSLGIGGIPKGKIIELSGPEDSLKTMFVLNMISHMQKSDIITAYVDVDRDLSEHYISCSGINPETLILLHLTNDNQIVEIIHKMVQEKAIDFIVIDSTGFINPAHEQRITVMFRNMLSKLARIIYDTDCTILFINQLRNNKAGEKMPLCNYIFDTYTSIRLKIYEVNKDTNEIGIEVTKNKFWHQLKRFMLQIA